uniref:Uncharacterized protein n=1 Tax=Vannella robusta TaxID=1487602 RepID=A0A7S4IH21_9EUKA|mmetsp:Transcript_25744/g.32833  ORF Transcript_25744/g.32833 Transcript_25744/m.32833 type:complete len:176 (+) Transcript_25744:18-545(+)
MSSRVVQLLVFFFLVLLCCVHSQNVVCSRDSDCNDDNICTIDLCLEGRCATFRSDDEDARADPNCCGKDVDCPKQLCRVAACFSDFRCHYSPLGGCSTSEGLSELYDDDANESSSEEGTGTSESSTEEEEDEDPGVGDIIGAVVGFVILGILVLSFIVVVILMVIQKIVRRLTER